MTEYIEHMEQLRERLAEIDDLVSKPDVLRDQKNYRDLMKERSRISEFSMHSMRRKGFALRCMRQKN